LKYWEWQTPNALEYRHNPAEGFTLMEALIVVMILGIVTAHALPTLTAGVGKSQLSGAASEIIVALEYAQLHAMTTGEETRLTIDQTADTILVESFKVQGDLFGGGSEMTENEVDNGSFLTMPHPTSKGKDYLIVFADEDRFGDVDIANVAFGAGNSLTFDAVGVPSEGGTVTLSLGSKQIVVTVDSLSGRVTWNE
jgi:prepilin-type N-terminal cleavage/methylation domain-containing protein